MAKLRVLLVCGSGASSGFMAANMRKAASEKGLELDIKARSESEILNYIDEIDCIMIGPHLTYALEDIKDDCKGTNVKVIMMKPDYYATLNGPKAIEHLLSEMNSK